MQPGWGERVIGATDLATRLATAGRPLIGFGDAGLVFGGGPDWVLKVGYDGDDGWPAWARWCQANPGPHVPMIHAMATVEHLGRPVAFFGVIERLQPTLVAARWMKGDRALKRDPWRLAGLIEAEHPTVAAILREAAAAFPDARFDAAPSNWMERDDGTVVLTDPIMRTEQKSTRRQPA